jgi:hypothetical protein
VKLRGLPARLAGSKLLPVGFARDVPPSPPNPKEAIMANSADDAALAVAIKHLSEYADGLEIAADCERRIEAAYAPELALWEANGRSSQGDANLNRMMRNMLDARSNATRITKDASALRTLLAFAAQAEDTNHA